VWDLFHNRLHVTQLRPDPAPFRLRIDVHDITKQDAFYSESRKESMPGPMKLLARLVAPLLLVAALAGCQSESKTDSGQTDPAIQSDTTAQDSLRIELVGVDRVTVLDLLKAAHEVDYRGSAVGAFVTRVDRAESGSEFFWMFSVNDSLPNTACDRYVTSDGDRVVWHYRRMRR
jgi:hypothetical protein